MISFRLTLSCNCIGCLDDDDDDDDDDELQQAYMISAFYFMSVWFYTILFEYSCVVSALLLRS